MALGNRVGRILKQAVLKSPNRMSEIVKTVASAATDITLSASPQPPAQPEESRKRSLPEDVSSDAKKPCLEGERVKRKKVALMLTYSGQGYLGMQRNPGTKTIEEDLLNALLKAGLIIDEAYNMPQSIHFQRAARTDKGVSAARQIVSLKLPVEGPVIQKINEHLPDQIRALGLKRVTRGFNSKTSCDARTYSYMLPTFSFTPANEDLTEEYRISNEVLDNVRDTLKVFQGTHNFHNFTSRKKPGDPSAHRYIINVECGEPFVRDGLEFTVVKIKGQSFMLHQIRKMVGISVAVARGLTTKETISRAWKPERLDIPVAPSLGLVLEEVHYDKYNRRYGSDGIHEPLDWSSSEEEVKKFKEEFIYPTIVNTEKNEKSMMTWLLTLPFHSYDVRDENESHGLAALGRAAMVIEEEAASSHGLSTLARAAQVLREEEDRMFDSDNDTVSSTQNSDTSQSSPLVCNGSENVVENKN